MKIRNFFGLEMLLVGMAMLAVGSADSQAAVLTEYTFTGSVYSPATVVPNSTVSSITAGTGATMSVGNQANWASQPYLAMSYSNLQTPSTSAALAITNGSYFEFTLSAAAGYVLDLDSLTFAVTKGGGSERGFAIQNSIIGFSSSGSTNLELSISGADITSTGAANADDYVLVSTQRGTPAFSSLSMDLNDTAYQNASSITFRVFNFMASNSQTLEFDNVTINGSVVAVPEPATFVCFIGGIGLILLKHRRSI